MSDELELVKTADEDNDPVVDSGPKSAKKERRGLCKRPSEEGGAVYKHAVATTITSFIIFITYGAALGALGATIPFLLPHVVSDTWSARSYLEYY